MSDKTAIEWTDATWNPVWGCTPVSPGCDHCYAETLVNGRLAHLHPGGFGTVRLRPEQIDKPLRWRKPRRIFVNSMSDLFHEAIPRPWLADIFAVMAATPRHTYQVLTKRHGPMRSVMNDDSFAAMVADRVVGKGAEFAEVQWPLPNVWLGVSVENQQWADIRIPALLDTPAAVRFLSCEPLLGPVDLHDLGFSTGATVDWVIVGGESGRGARPMHPDWARNLRNQCLAAGVPFLFKQWGEWAPGHRNVRLSKHRWQYESTRFAPDGTAYKASEPDLYGYPGMQSVLRVGKRKAGRELDGRTWDQYPERAA